MKNCLTPRSKSDTSKLKFNLIRCMAAASIIISLVGCSGVSQEDKAKQEAEAKNDQVEQNIKQQIEDGITMEALKYISGDVSVSVWDSDNSTKASVNARAILPQAIPLVAENICPSSVEAIEENNITDYTISVKYYQESNAEGVIGDSIIDWYTNDGKSGVLIEDGKRSIVKYTIEGLYGRYDNFGKESSVEDKEMTLQFSFQELTGIYSGDVNAAGLPDGYGTFTRQAPEGSGWAYEGPGWTYEGDWKNGHFDGIGICTWESGQVYSGGYSNDCESGQGKLTYPDGSYFEGIFTSDENPNANMRATVVLYESNGISHNAKLENGSMIFIDTPEEIEKFKSASEQKNTESTDNSSTNKSSENKDIVVSGDRTVYVTKTGKRYHYDSNCNGGTYTESTLSAAKSKGLTPCKKCAGG